MGDSDDDLFFNPFTPVSEETKKRFDKHFLDQKQIDEDKIKEESRVRNEERRKEEAKNIEKTLKRKASETKRFEKEELLRRISVLLPEELTAEEREYLRGLNALDAGWGYGLSSTVSLEAISHDSASELQKYSDIVFRIIDNLKRFQMFNASDVYLKLPQITNVGVLTGPGAKRATELMKMALTKPGFAEELRDLATKPPGSFQFKIISDAATALILISEKKYKDARDVMLADKTLYDEYAAVNELKSKQASPKRRRKSNSGRSGGKLTRKAYFRKIR